MSTRTRQHNVNAVQWAANGSALGPQDLTLSANQVFGSNVFSLAVQRQRLPSTSTASFSPRSRAGRLWTRRWPTRWRWR